MNGGAVPRLARGFRLAYDERRGAWLLLGPERVIEADEIAAEILGLVDGSLSLDEIVARLAESFAAERADISRDVHDFVADLAERKVLDVDDPAADRAPR